jgi:hypothetical protein
LPRASCDTTAQPPPQILNSDRHPSSFSQSQRDILALYIILIFFASAVQSALNGKLSEEPLVGWQPNPDRRGALSILKSCILTIIAYTWSIQHLNVPAPSGSRSTRLRRKIRHALMTIFLPEVVLPHAIVERAPAIEYLKELDDR